MECEPILKAFGFLKKAGFKEVIKVPNGFCYVRYDYKSIYLDMGTDYREKTDYFSMTLLTGEIKEYLKIGVIPEVKNIYEFDIGSLKDREMLKSLENTNENYKNVLETYTEFLKKNLTELLELCMVLDKSNKCNKKGWH